MKKKILVLLIVAFGLTLGLKTPMLQAAGEKENIEYVELDDEFSPQESTEEEVIVEEEDEEEVPVIEDDFLVNLNQTLAVVFAWVGGFSGLAAILLFSLRFIKERTLFKTMKKENALSNQEMKLQMKELEDLRKAVAGYSASNDELQKIVFTLIAGLPISAEIKKNTLSNISLKETLDLNIQAIKEEEEKLTQANIQLKNEAETLLSKLAKKV